MDGIIFCRKCGQKNNENNYKCTACGYLLHGRPAPQYVTDDYTMGGLIPYRNVQALWSYYLGIFSLIPCAGILLGIAAVILGIRGLKAANRNPQIKGRVHAWVGILFGGACALGYIALMALIAITTRS